LRIGPLWYCVRSQLVVAVLGNLPKRIFLRGGPSGRQRRDCDLILFRSNYRHSTAAGMAQPEILQLRRVATNASFHNKQFSIVKPVEFRRARGLAHFSTTYFSTSDGQPLYFTSFYSRNLFRCRWTVRDDRRKIARIVPMLGYARQGCEGVLRTQGGSREGEGRWAQGSLVSRGRVWDAASRQRVSSCLPATPRSNS
jgi:hypothetical protein